MSKDDVIEILKTVNYPGFTRDLVSFGIVKDVQVVGSDVTVDLEISTPSEQRREEIKALVEKALNDAKSFDSIDVRIGTSPQSQPRTAQPPGTLGAPTVPLEGVKRTVAIASGKGGVGTSTVAANLAAALAVRGHRVGLLDLDIYGPSLPILLGLNESPSMTAERKLVPLEKFGMKVMSFGFLSGNETPVIWRGPMVARMTEQFFTDVLWGELDFLILDLPPGTGDVQLTLTQKLRISGAVIVTTPQDLALTDVRKAADMFRKVQAPVVGVVENMSGYVASGVLRDKEGRPLRGATISFAEMDGFRDVQADDEGRFRVEMDLFKRGGGVAESDRLQVPLLGQIPISQELMESCDEGIPVVIKDPDSHISQTLFSIADSLYREVESP
ncbi:MAG: Mrp/NBP35 family ATP-binding protein [Fidelibacterota bacterium]